MLYCCYLCTFVKLVMRNKDIYIYSTPRLSGIRTHNVSGIVTTIIQFYFSRNLCRLASCWLQYSYKSITCSVFYQMREIHRTLILEHTIQIVPNENSKLEFHSLIKKKLYNLMSIQVFQMSTFITHCFGQWRFWTFEEENGLKIVKQKE